MNKINTDSYEPAMLSDGPVPNGCRCKENKHHPIRLKCFECKGCGNVSNSKRTKKCEGCNGRGVPPIPMCELR